MTTYNYKVFKNYPVQFTVKNPRCWWQTINTAYGEDTTVDVEMKEFEGLQHTFTNPLVHFERQELLDHNTVEEQTRILAPYSYGVEYPYPDGVTDINVVGTLTEDNGVYSGFSTANYLQTSTSPINTNRGEWEYMVKFTTGSDVSTSQRIVHALPAATTRYGTGLYISGGKMDYLISFNGSSWGIDVDGTHTLSPNTTYWVRFSYKNQKYLGEISTDGVTFEEDYVVSNANTLYPSLPVLRFGVSYATKYEAPFLGSIDLKECYFKAGDRILWDYSHTKYFEGCLDGFVDNSSEATYTAVAKFDRVLLSKFSSKSGYVWANTVTIPEHEVYYTADRLNGDNNYFPPAAPIE
jgi:hypothetical protein